ncbi:MAG: 16S rRNA (uracil(1498)-N(3))-methyltransferase [Flavobacteriaceae bacterium]|jgi:16S rRNA (uracil1498-N3)-methyltransferase|nr:16S rRNA (uracil(1498)-N(3))-methyltransferase [Flavobacteriaceae bacterium]
MKLFYGQIFPEIKLNDDEQQHITKVLRMREGEEIFVTDGKGNLAKGNLVFKGKTVIIDEAEIQENLPDFSPKLHIAIAPTKNMDRTEFFVEKAVELGVSEITFLQTEKSERKNINIERIVKQSVAASKQSLRFYFPKINNLTKLSDFIKNINSENTFVAHCHKNLERQNLSDIPKLENITFLIGPEGDFSEKEILFLAENGIKAVSFGNQRLRTETAGIFAAAWIRIRNL